MKDVYQKVFERLLSEFSSMSGGAVGGVSTPLGTGPKAGSRGEKIYKKSTATDKKHRSKGKKKKTHTRSVQWYLKHGGEKGRKRTFREMFSYLNGDILFERTKRLYDMSPDDVLSFLSHLRGDIQQETTFTMSEKISGQNTTVGILGTSEGRNSYFFALKDSLKKNNDVFHPKYDSRSGASGYVSKRFQSRYHRVKVLDPGEKITLGLEIVKPDRQKPDYIAYNVPERTTQVAVFSGPFDKRAAKIMSDKYVNFLTLEDIAKTPAGKDLLSQEILEKIGELYKLTLENVDLDKKDFTKFVKQEILPQLRPHITAIFGKSMINPLSPIEGIAVNINSEKDSKFFKIHSGEFENIQQAQTSLYADYQTKRTFPKEKRLKYESSLSNQDFLMHSDRFGNYIRAGLLYDYVNNQGNQRGKRSFGYFVFNYIRRLSEMTHYENTRVFVSPKSFKTLCVKLLSAINNNTVESYISFINYLSTKIPRSRKGFQWHIVKTGDQYDCPEAQQIINLNFDL